MNNLKYFRRTINVNQKDIGDLVGVGQSTIDRYENGKRKVTVPMAWKIVQALNQLGAACSFSDVFPEPQLKLISAKNKA